MNLDSDEGSLHTLHTEIFYSNQYAMFIKGRKVNWSVFGITDTFKQPVCPISRAFRAIKPDRHWTTLCRHLSYHLKLYHPGGSKNSSQKFKKLNRKENQINSEGSAQTRKHGRCPSGTFTQCVSISKCLSLTVFHFCLMTDGDSESGFWSKTSWFRSCC